MDGFIKGFPGFLLFLVILMTFVHFVIVKPLPVLDKIFNGIEKLLLALKLPKLLVGIIMYVVLWIPIVGGMLLAVYIVDYLGLG